MIKKHDMAMVMCIIAAGFSVWLGEWTYVAIYLALLVALLTNKPKGK